MGNHNLKLAISVLALVLAPGLSAADKKGTSALSNGPANVDKITREVRHELVVQPYYGVFDDLSYSVNGSEVSLFGSVVTPALKSDVENAVKRIEGVTKVENNIKVLPPSSMDDQIRRAEYRAIYSRPELQRYSMRAIPPIHIIVNGGHVTLDGVVDSASDKTVAGVAANSVPSIFSVDNNLVVGK